MNIALQELIPPVRLIGAVPIAVDAFWEFCAENRDLRCERLPNGEIVIMTPTKRDTGSKSGYIGRMLGNWADDDGRGEYFDSSTGFEQSDTAILSPDAAWASFQKIESSEKDGQELPMCPEFVIELRSKTDTLTSSREKMARWTEYGAELAWLIDPVRKAVEIYRPGQAMEEQVGHSSVSGEGPVAGFVLELRKVWG